MILRGDFLLALRLAHEWVVVVGTREGVRQPIVRERVVHGVVAAIIGAWAYTVCSALAAIGTVICSVEG